MTEQQKIKLINAVIEQFFSTNTGIKEIQAKDLMDDFIKAGIFIKDDKKGLPIRNLLRKLDSESQLHKIPTVDARRKLVNTNWYFVNWNK